ncbi:MAG: hypothetical protein JW936_03700 [Sedimentisphaerales bacterium]|nr:hypothetical protein [Sedimentisphaerales bacterium]
MADMELKRKINIPAGSQLSEKDYIDFLLESYQLIKQCDQYLAPEEDINSFELAHLIPQVKESIIAIYVGINDAVCNKGLVSPFLVRHGHNNVFVFDPQLFPGGDSVPSGTVDAKQILNGFEPPNDSWNKDWTYVMIEDPARTFAGLWAEAGYIDMIPAKFEDFTVISDHNQTKLCTFIDPKAFEHPVNKSRPYLKQARDRGQKSASEFTIPQPLQGETEGLVPVVLNKAEKLYVARPDFGPCAHCWSNIHPDNQNFAVVNENSAVPLDLVIAKPPVDKKYAANLIPAKGSADMTTDWFYRGQQIVRNPILQGLFKG